MKMVELVIEGAGRYHCQCVPGFQGENCTKGKSFNVLTFSELIELGQNMNCLSSFEFVSKCVY